MKHALAVLTVAFLVGPFSANAQMPVVSAGGVLNGASFAQGQPVAAGSLVSIFGTQLAGSMAQASTVPLSTTLADVSSVTFNGVSAPLDFVSPGQINAQVPFEVAPPDGASANVSMVVSRGTLSSAAASVPLTSAAPGLFTIGGMQAVAINSDSSIAAASGSITGVTTRPARPGDTIILYATGLGAVTPAVQTGQSSSDQLRRTVGMPTVTIGGFAAQVPFSGLTPQFPGVNQLNVVIPANVAAGSNVPVVIQLNGIMNQATIAISP
jgi:uncharacterized protein (TIGR03437 family)